MQIFDEIDEAEKYVVQGSYPASVGLSILESFEMKKGVLAFTVALGTLAIAQQSHAASCANGVYQAGCAGPNDAAVVHKAPTKPHSAVIVSVFTTQHR